MSSLATKSFNTKRISNEEYKKIKTYFNIIFLDKYVKDLFLENLFNIPLSIKEKDSHGDVDLLTTISLKELYSFLIDNHFIFIHPDFKENINKTSISLPIKINIQNFINNNNLALEKQTIENLSKLNLTTNFFQLNLINTSKKDFDCHYHYLCFNDLGNMLSRVAFGIGVRFEQNGLFYEFPKEHKYVKVFGRKDSRIFLSNDYFNILKALGYKIKSKEDFYQKFNTEKDLYTFITSSSLIGIKLINKTHHNKKDFNSMNIGFYKNSFSNIINTLISNGLVLKESIASQLKILEAKYTKYVLKKEYKNR